MMKQVKVDNWGIYFLQRLKHFFNRTDYCDLTLQFMDNAQLKVHRLVLNACTEYFDVLERTCEMYEDYLIMPDDLQADVVVPIVNFMYTGQLEYNPEMLEKLIHTAQIMNIPVLAKLLDAQRQQKTYNKQSKVNPTAPIEPTLPVPKTSNLLPKQLKRPARVAPSTSPPSKKPYIPINKKPSTSTIKVDTSNHINSSPDPSIIVKYRPKPVLGHHGSYMPMLPKQKYRPPAPRPTRCELPEDLEEENLLTDSFSTISYDSKPLIVHPETTKRYAAVKQRSLYTDVLSVRKSSTIDIIENKIKKPKFSVFEDLTDYYEDDVPEKTEDKSHIFDEVVKNSNPRVTIEGDDNQEGSSIDHAKIISEVLKKYPYLVKGNKSIKLKILDTKPPPKPKKTSRRASKSPKAAKIKLEPQSIDIKPSYPADMLDSKEAAHLIGLGAENVSGPWICMICGTPGKALSFASYYAFRRHLVEVHHEKIISNRCEHCGYKTNKISYLLHHLYTKHDVPPPQHCNFPKCSECGFIAQNPAHLVKHKMMHSTKRKKCSVCYFEFSTTANLMRHIKVTGHAQGLNYAHRRDIQCLYCAKPFVREQNLFIHYKSNHPDDAKRDGIVEDSDDEMVETAEDSEESEVLIKIPKKSTPADPLGIKNEPNLYNNTYDSEESVDALGINSQLVSERKPAPAPVTQRLLNASFEVEIANQPEEDIPTDEFNANITVKDTNSNEFVLPNSEFTQNKQPEELEYFISDQNEENDETAVAQEAVIEETPNTDIPEAKQPVNEGSQQVQIVVSNEEEYKALMASNHPIIFDADGNPTKTLAVLTTPQSVAISSAPMQVVSENTNNMMILPEDYGCVSQTPGDGNIVVVYSQQLVGDNKQYIVDNSFTQAQIVSAADMNTHFIQTSAGLTPSYTSATSSTMVQGQDVMPQTIVSWDGNVAQEMVAQQTHAQEHIEIMQEQEHIAEEIANAEEEVEAHPTVQYDMQNQNDGTHNLEGESDSQGTLENIQICEPENSSVTTDDIQLLEESCSQSPVEDTNKISENVSEEQTSMQISNIELPSNEVEIHEEISNHEPNDTECTGRISTNDVMTNGSNDDEYMPLENLNINVPKENIENLTSEWSDDEVETGTIDLDENASIEELPEPMETEDKVSIEESIENIQQEVAKHEPANNLVNLTTANNIQPEITENDNDFHEEILEDNDINQDTTEEIKQETANDVQESQPTVNVALETGANNLMKTQHKITSLLNDWVENDNESQDEDDTGVSQESSIEEAGESAAMEEGNVIEIVTHSGSESVGKMAINPDINNLVNDWEEEEETNE